MRLWETWRMSQSLRKSPSEILHLTNPVSCFYFDRAVWRFGSAIDTELEDISSNAKTKPQAVAQQASVMVKWLGTSEGMYRDPAAG